jgi:hypothetical protein
MAGRSARLDDRSSIGVGVEPSKIDEGLLNAFKRFSVVRRPHGRWGFSRIQYRDGVDLVGYVGTRVAVAQARFIQMARLSQA